MKWRWLTERVRADDRVAPPGGGRASKASLGMDLRGANRRGARQDPTRASGPCASAFPPSVFAVLEDGGYFVFDLNMEEGFRSRWRGSFEFVEEDHVCVVRSSHDANEKTGRLDVTLFESKDSGWVRTDFPLIQRWYEEREIRKRLRKAGFEELKSCDGNEPILQGSLHEGRMFFVARKRDAHQPRGERRPECPQREGRHPRQLLRSVAGGGAGIMGRRVAWHQISQHASLPIRESAGTRWTGCQRCPRSLPCRR